MARSLDIDLEYLAQESMAVCIMKTSLASNKARSNVSASSATQVKEAPVQATQASQTQVPTSTVTQRADTVEPIRGVKAVMARMMVESVSSIPHFTYCEEFDLTDLVALRESMKVKYSSDEAKLTMMPFFMKSMSLALSQFPVMNSQGMLIVLS